MEKKGALHLNKLPPYWYVGYMEVKMCKQCKGDEVVKCGIHRGKQRYLCKTCCKRFVERDNRVRHKEENKAFAIELYVEGLGTRSIGRLLKVSHVSVQRWIRDHSFKEPRLMPSSVKAIEIDEVYFYLGKKGKKRWLWLAVCRESKRILDFQIGNRDKATVKKLYLKLSSIACSRYYTDDHMSYQVIFPKEKHKASKKYTYTVEGINSALRHYLARFRRRTKCYSKKEEMTGKSIELLIRKFDDR